MDVQWVFLGGVFLRGGFGNSRQEYCRLKRFGKDDQIPLGIIISFLTFLRK